MAVSCNRYRILFLISIVVLTCVVSLLINYTKDLARSTYINNSELDEHERRFSLDTNKTEKKVCTGSVPGVIIQYGLPRTASTLQFQIICLMILMAHKDEAQEVMCQFLARPHTKYGVTKSHNLELVFKSTEDVVVFMTASDKESVEHKRSKSLITNKNITVCLTVDTKMVSKLGYRVAYEYQPIFEISDDDMEHIISYLRYWEILRRCCGRQMSDDWRHHLSPIPNYTRHYSPQDIAYPACEMYNISATEELFRNTYIYSHFAHFKHISGTIGKPSTVDAPLTGHYCETCNKNIRKKHLHKINDKC